MASECMILMSSCYGRLGTRQQSELADAIRIFGLSLCFSSFMSVFSPICPQLRIVQATSCRSTVPSYMSASSTGRAPPYHTNVYIRFNAATAYVLSRMS